MSTETEVTDGQRAAIVLISDERKALATQIENLNRFKELPDAKASGRALACAITKLEEARMWLGKALEPLPTGYKQTDLPTVPGSDSTCKPHADPEATAAV